MAQKSSRRPTLTDVAAEAGVSVSLASLALRGGKGVREETKIKILKAAKKLGYRANRSAQSLVAGHSKVIGVVVTDLANPYSTGILNVIEDKAQDFGFDVFIGHGRSDPALLQARIERLIEWGAEGIIVISGHLDSETLHEFSRITPLVVIGRYRGLKKITNIHNDDEHGSRLAIDHLQSLGHTSVVYVTSSDRLSATVRGETAAEHAISLGMEFQRLSTEEAIEHIPNWFGSHKKFPRAVFANNDMTALKIVAHANAHGLRIPEDIRVIGYDDSTLATMATPQLTSIRQPLPQLGTTAIELLKEKMNGATDVQHVSLRPTLVVRESTAAATEDFPTARPDF